MKKKVVNGVTVLTFEAPQAGIEYLKQFLVEQSDSQTVVFLPGGSTPKPLFEALIKGGTFTAGAVVLADERYGEPMHRISNEFSLQESGFLEYLKGKNIPFYSMLREGMGRVELGKEIEKMVSQLFTTFPKKIAVLGMGEDGHTAGLAPNRPDFTNPLYDVENSERLVAEFKDPVPMSPEGSPAPPNGFGERITMTIKAFSKMDKIIILVFGEKKNEALKKVLTRGKIEEAPLRFVLEDGVAVKTTFITDITL